MTAVDARRRRWLVAPWAPRLVVGAMALGGLAMWGDAARAGWLVVPGMYWQTYSVRPLAAEQTPNYTGYGARLTLGYSVNQVLDFGLFGAGGSGARDSGGLPGESQLGWYGGELGLRLAEAVYFGLRGGQAVYNLDSAEFEGEPLGQWLGVGGGVSLGAILKMSRRTAWQVTFDLSHAELAAPTPAGEPRHLDAVSLTIGYVFNGFHNSRIENTIFKDYLDHLQFL